MENKIRQIGQMILSQSDSQIKQLSLFSGITLSFHSVHTDKITVCHPQWKQLLAINYCSAGRIAWKMDNGKQLHLGPGDFTVHMLDVCSHSQISFPSGSYEGLTLYIDLEEAVDTPPMLMADTGLSLNMLAEKFCADGKVSSFAGNSQTSPIFSGFYQNSDTLGLAMQKIKCLELLLYLLQLPTDKSKPLSEYQSELVEIVHRIHTQLTLDMEKRFTIEELSRQYGVNPTTLKAVFKSVYGNSLAAHMKEHRMEYAARLLRETDASIAQISQKTGYESQSKFTLAFKESFHMLPREYRKITQTNDRSRQIDSPSETSSCQTK